MNDDADLDIRTFDAAYTPISALTADEVVALPGTATVREAATLLTEAGVGLLVIGDADHAEAVISERDVVSAVAAGWDLDDHSVIEAGSSEIRWAPSGATVADVLKEMMENYLRHILVRSEDGALAGVVSMRDLLATAPQFDL